MADDLVARLRAVTANSLICREAADALAEQAETIQRLRGELETERLRLAGCGVAALADTPRTAAERLTRDSPYWSASYGDVCHMVDRLMRMRVALELACPEDPFDGGDLPCGFCGIDPGSAHKSNCAWVVAREALRDDPPSPNVNR